MNRKDLFNRLYNKLLISEVFDVMNYSCNDDLEKEVMEIIEEVFRDYIILQGDVLP